MSDSWRNSISAETNQKGNTDKESKSCSNKDKGSFLFLLFEIDISRGTIQIIIHIFSKVIATTDNWIE